MKTKVFLLIVWYILLPALYMFGQGSGYAIDFDGVDDYIEVSSSSGDALNPGSITVECWAYFNEGFSSSHRPHFVTKNLSYALIIETNGHLKFYIFTGGSSSNVEGVITIQPNRWYHLCGTYDASTGTISVYVNGVLDNSGTITPAPLDQNDNPFRIGTRLTTNPAHFVNGIIDEVRVWDVARSINDIRSTLTKKLTGAEANLVGYWRLDEGSGTIVSDLSPSGKDGVLINMGNLPANWVVSGAYIGDESAFSYQTDWTNISLSLSHSDGDGVTVSQIAGNPEGVHIYRIDQAPNVTDVPPGSGWAHLDPLRYWGVFFAETAVTPAASGSIVYDYTGHPGISNENDLRIAYRENNASPSWTDAGASLDVNSNTLTMTGFSNSEIILGSATLDNSLPVKLAMFEGLYKEGKIYLKWKTEAEQENLGFIIYRKKKEESEFRQIASYITDERLRGLGNSSTGQDYIFEDHNFESGFEYLYVLESVDFSGLREKYGPISVLTKEMPHQITKLEVLGNYPNPFNPVTYIRVKHTANSKMLVVIYNKIGQVVYQNEKQFSSSGIHEIKWDAAGLPSGIYFYSVYNVDQKYGKILTNSAKMLLLK